MNDEEQIVAWIGVDWADEDHKVWEYNVGTGGKDNYAVPHSAESLQEWVRQLRTRYGGKRVAVILEQARGGLVYALMGTDFIVIYLLPPTVLGAIPEGAISQWGEKRSRRCRTVGRNGPAKSGTISNVGAG